MPVPLLPEKLTTNDEIAELVRRVVRSSGEVPVEDETAANPGVESDSCLSIDQPGHRE